MADGMEHMKLSVNEDFAKKLHKQKEKAELDQRKYCRTLRERSEGCVWPDNHFKRV